MSVRTLELATDFVRMHLRTAVKGLSVRSCSAPPGRKHAEGQCDPAPSRAPASDVREGGQRSHAKTESSRVRPDHVSCCIVPPPSSDRRSRKRASSNRAGETDEGIPGRGSCVRLTSSVVSRSWLFEYVRIHFCIRTSSERDRGVQRWRTFAASRREDNARFEAGLHHRSAQRRRQTPSEPDPSRATVTERIRVPV